MSPDASRSARARRWLLAGAVLLLVSVLGFVHYARRDAETLRSGTRADGEVIDRIDGHGWNPFDLGRIVVYYSRDGEPTESEVYIDNDLSDYPIGTPLTVVYRGDHVRTTREPNDPAPIGAVLLLAGLLGLGGLGRGVALRLRPRPPAAEPAPGARDRITLVTWRLAPRKGVLDVYPDRLSIFVPSLFGRRRLELPIAGSAVAPVETDEVQEAEEFAPGPLDDGDGVVFKEPIRIADLPTASPLRSGNLLVVVDPPVRVPSLRWLVGFAGNVDLPFTVRETRSADGAYIDGVVLRAVDPVLARERLVAAGVQPIQDPLEWLAQHRELETDLELRAELIAEDLRDGRSRLLQSLLSGAGWLLLLVASWRDDLRLAVVGGAAMAAGFILGWLTRRRARSKAARN